MTRHDYNGEFYSRYAEARKLLPETMRLWMDKALEHAKGRTVRKVIDVGSGTGRFSPLLADAFGAEVVGIEPSDQMREAAVAANRNPRVGYLKGSAESLPVGNGEFDLAWMSMVIHHVRDRESCGREVSRVLRPGGIVMVRNTFGDRLPSVNRGMPLYDYFPGALEADQRRLPSVAEVTGAFERAGIVKVGFEGVVQMLDSSLRVYLPRLRKGASSTLELLTDAQREEGFRRMEEAVGSGKGDEPLFETIDLLVFEKA